MEMSDEQGRALSREKCDTVMAAVKKDMDTLRGLVHEGVRRLVENCSVDLRPPSSIGVGR